MTPRIFSPMLAMILVWLCPIGGESHDSLYDYMEIRIGADGTAEYAISVHAPDFLLDPTLAVDAIEDGWFEKLTPGGKSTLIRLANQSIEESLTLQSKGSEKSAVATLPIVPIPSDAGIDTTIRPDSLITSAPIPADCDTLSIQYAGGKRLMIVVNRPGRFPEVHDLAPESEIQLSLLTATQTEP